MSTEQVLVAAATTVYGAAIAHSLLQAGMPVRALVSDLAHPAAERLRRRGARLAWCPASDGAALHEALDGIAVVCAGAYERAQAERHTEQELALIEAASRSGIRHFIYSSHPAAHVRTGVPQFDSRHEVERYLHASGLRSTVLCPALFMEQLLFEPLAGSLRRGLLPLAELSGQSLQLIAQDDAVRFARIVLARLDQYAGRRIIIASDQLTAIEMAAVLARTAGRAIQVTSMPDAARANELRVAAAAPRADVAALRRLHPEVNWHTLEGWARRLSWGA